MYGLAFPNPIAELLRVYGSSAIVLLRFGVTISAAQCRVDFVAVRMWTVL